MYHIVYETTNIVNGMTYSGVHSTNKLHDTYLGSGYALTAAIKKYGKENFQRKILAICPTRAFAFEIEKQMVTEEAVKDRSNYNLTVGGREPPDPTGRKIKKKTIDKLRSNSIKLWKDEGYRKRHREAMDRVYATSKKRTQANKCEGISNNGSQKV